MSDELTLARVAAASLNQTVGDWRGNVARVLLAIDGARAEGATLLVLPELALSGYSMGDRVLRRGTGQRAWKALVEVLPHTAGMVVLAGLPIRHRGVLHNAVAVLADGRVAGLVPKENLASGDVLYENRWYAGWRRGDVESWRAPSGEIYPLGTLLFEAEGLGRFAVEVCEDGWLGDRPGSAAAVAGAGIVCNPSASWFMVGKHAVRRGLVEQASREDHVVYLYASLMGCDDTRIVFDGSVLIARDGATLAEGQRLRFGSDVGVVAATVDLGRLHELRVEEGSWRARVEAQRRGDRGSAPTVVRVEGRFGSHASQPTAPVTGLDPSLAWVHEALGRAPGAADLGPLELELGLCLGLREYLRKTGISGVVIGLSGGRDSAMVALLAARMRAWEGKSDVAQCVTTLGMPTAQSGEATADAARRLARALGTRHFEVPAEAVASALRQAAEHTLGRSLSWGDAADDRTLQNLQARARGALSWTMANALGQTLLTTSNLSEVAVGYATMDGDTCGGLAPLAGVPKTMVSTWLQWAATFHRLPELDAILAMPPTAELRPAAAHQTDEADLMPYVVLDRLMGEFVDAGHDPIALFEAAWPDVHGIYGDDMRAFARDIRRFVTLFCAAQWKRERTAVGFRVGAFDLDPASGLRWPVVGTPFLEELDDLDAFVAKLR